MNEIKGIPASKGKCTGVARVMKSIDEIKKFKQGDVLVTEATSPLWTPIMQTASAIVTDVGGALSHAAIVSRELEIPAVVGTKNATKEIPDGAQIEVDGEEGLVRVL